MTIAAKIRSQRESKRYSQEFMAARLNITQSTYSRIETGFTRPDIQKLKIISEILDISILHFIVGD